MKKVVMVLLVLTVAMGASAQVDFSVKGSIQMDFGIEADGFDEGGTSWYWDMLNNGGTYIQANADSENVTAWVRVRGDKNFVFMGDATVNLSDALALSVGFNRLPVHSWSSWELWADNHIGFGASSTSRTPYIQVKYGDFFLGVAEGGVMNGRDTKWLVNDDPDRVNLNAWSPYFYLGYNYKDDDGQFNAGAAFVGAHLNRTIIGRSEEVFTFMGKAYFTYLGLDPATLGVNVALYGSPLGTMFTIRGNPLVAARGADDMILEALLDVGLGLDICDIGFAGGLVVNLADKDEGGGGMGIKLGLSATFDLGGGFKFVPGIGFTNLSFDDDNSHSLLDFGLSFMYSF